jgi:hypothetical protein
MSKFIFLVTLLVISALCVCAQNDPRGTSRVDNVQDALRDPDPIHRDERLIAGANRNIRRVTDDRTITPPPRVTTATPGPIFKAQVIVTNHSTKFIKSVSWTATLTQPGSTEVIAQNNLYSEVNIAPGKTKKLTKKVQIRPIRVVNAANLPSGKEPPVADLKVAVTEVTYADGSKSKTP